MPSLIHYLSQNDLSEDGSDEEETKNNELGIYLTRDLFFLVGWKMDKDKLEVTFTNNFISFSS